MRISDWSSDVCSSDLVDRIVLGAAVVPERHRALLPAEAAGELRLHLVAEQEFQDRRALLLGHALEMRGVGEVHVERLAARLGVGAHRRVPRAELVALEADGRALHRLAARLLPGALARAVHCGERSE